jgi:hypothetical protein
VPKAVSEGKGWSPNSKCAHGYMNSFLCERAGGGCGNKRKSAMR